MPTPSGATDVNGAAKRLSGLLNSEQSLPTEDEKPEEQEAQAEDQEDEATETEHESEAETEESEAEEEAKYKVKVNGEELEVTLDELQKSYMMESDYRKKTTEISREREAIEQKQAEIDKQLEDARLLLDEEIANLDSDEMKELKEYDPETYIKQKEKIDRKVKKFEELKQKRAEEHQKRQEKMIAKERDALLSAFPEWSDQKEMVKGFESIFNVMREYGYSDSELNQITDHRMLILAHKALQLDKINKANIEAKKTKPKPKSMKPGSSTTKIDQRSEEAKRQREKLRKTGNIRDAAKLLTM